MGFSRFKKNAEKQSETFYLSAVTQETRATFLVGWFTVELQRFLYLDWTFLDEEISTNRKNKLLKFSDQHAQILIYEGVYEDRI